MLNLTQHNSLPEQNIREPDDKARVVSLLTFDSLPSRSEIEARAIALAKIARDSGESDALIGGAPYLMGPLEWALIGEGIMPHYAFSLRRSTETVVEGQLVKQSQFQQIGLIPVWGNCVHIAK